MSSGSSSTQRPDPGGSFPATVRPEYHAQAMPMMSSYQPLPPPWFLPTATYPGQWVIPQCAVSFRPPPTRTFYHPTSSARDTSTPPPAYDETYYPPFPMTAPTPRNTQCQTQVIATPKTEDVNRSLGESHAKPELVPQGWLMGRSASDSLSPIASSSAGPSTTTQFRPTPTQDNRPRLKRTWEARPRAVGSQHPPITSPYAGVFPNISGGSGQSVCFDMHTDELSVEENDSDGMEEIPLVAYKQPTVHRRQVKVGPRKEKSQREDTNMDLEQYPISSLVEPGSPVASDSSLPIRDFVPYSYDDYTPRTRGQNKDRGDTQPSQIKRSEPLSQTAREGSNEGIVRAPVKHESLNRNTSFQDCFGDTSDLTDLEDDRAESQTGTTTTYVRRVPVRAAKQSRPEFTQETPQLRPTRDAARKASVLIQALNSPGRKLGGSDPSSEQHKRSRDIYVEVEDEDSEESQRSTGMRTIRNGKKAGKLSHDPVPDYGITKVRRGRVAASDPSLVQSSIVHVCPIPSCGACFKRREHVKRHVRGIHTMEKPFTCLHDGCEKSFARRDNLGLHYSKVHKMSNRKCLELLATGDA